MAGVSVAARDIGRGAHDSGGKYASPEPPVAEAPAEGTRDAGGDSAWYGVDEHHVLSPNRAGGAADLDGKQINGYGGNCQRLVR